jgi:ATP-binding cassette subfamily B protein
MSFLRLYGRVLALLAPEARLAITLAVANIALAVSQFVEPVLFGRIIDRLTGALPAGLDAAARVLAPLIGVGSDWACSSLSRRRLSPGSPTGWRIAAAIW